MGGQDVVVIVDGLERAASSSHRAQVDGVALDLAGRDHRRDLDVPVAERIGTADPAASGVDVTEDVALHRFRDVDRELGDRFEHDG